MDISTLETWLWDAACAIRGATDAPKFKDFILPLVFYKRLSDVFGDEFAEQVRVWGDEQTAYEVVAEDHADALRTGRKPIVRFFIPEKYSSAKIRNHPADTRLGEFVTEALRHVEKLNPELAGIFTVDYGVSQAGQRILDDDRLSALIEVISQHRLGMKNASPDILGHAYEYLLRKFAEGQGQSAGEFYTPMEVGRLIARLINPIPKAHIYDCACGSARLLIKARLVYEQRNPKAKSKAPRLYGQESNATTFALAKMNMFLHDYTDAKIAIGDTFLKPQFAAKGAGLRRFDYVVANPMWNQKNYDEVFYENDPYDRFSHGTPPNSSADWGWVQHIFASLNDTGRAAIVLDTGAVSRGSGGRSSNKERTIRQAFVENDWIEGVILLPENLFYNTTAFGIILLLNRRKNNGRKGQIILVNASAHFRKEKPKNVLTDEGIEAVAGVYKAWETRAKLSKVITLKEVQEADYNLSPSQFVETGSRAKHRAIADILVDLGEAQQAREKADAELNAILGKLGFCSGGKA